MGIKKVARPMNKAKNAFVDWLKGNGATCIDGLDFNPTSDGEWVYYASISGFIGDSLYTARFMVWKSCPGFIDYSDNENTYRGISVDEFMGLIG